MTFEQCVQLKEIGFPQKDMLKNVICDEWGEYHFKNPTAEEALEWVNKKLISRVVLIVNDSVNIIYYQANFEFNKCFDTLSDAVYALIIWAYENKLLEGK